jgi:hypothetical protein
MPTVMRVMRWFRIFMSVRNPASTQIQTMLLATNTTGCRTPVPERVGERFSARGYALNLLEPITMISGASPQDHRDRSASSPPRLGPRCSTLTFYIWR